MKEHCDCFYFGDEGVLPLAALQPNPLWYSNDMLVEKHMNIYIFLSFFMFPLIVKWLLLQMYIFEFFHL